MKVLLYIIILCILILVSFLLKNKNIIATMICSLLILSFIISPKLCIDSAVSGALLFFYKVFPSLFPFLVLSNIMLCYDGVEIYSKLLGKAICYPIRLPTKCSFVLIISALCGYPLGAKYSCDLYNEGDIDYNTFLRLINIASNPSPLFIIGSVGTSMLGNPSYGYILLISCYLSCIIMGIILPSKKQKVLAKKAKTYLSNNKNLGNNIKESIDNSIKTCFSVAGFIILFSVLNSIIKYNVLFNYIVNKLSVFMNIENHIIQGILLGSIEMTNGCSMISSSNISPYSKLVIISFLISFSGLSIISQVYSFIFKYNVPIKRYMLLKILQGIITSSIVVIILNIPSIKATFSTISFNFNSNIICRYNNFIICTYIVILVIFSLPWLNHLINNRNTYNK